MRLACVFLPGPTFGAKVLTHVSPHIFIASTIHDETSERIALKITDTATSASESSTWQVLVSRRPNCFFVYFYVVFDGFGPL